jgi:hypothetical protein
MEKIHHRPIKRFGFDGIIHSDSGLWRLRVEYTRLILTQMKIAGYVPRVDIPVDFTIEYNEDKNYFEFQISVYGIYVGKRKSEWILGVNETTVLCAPPNKLNESLSESA